MTWSNAHRWIVRHSDDESPDTRTLLKFIKCYDSETEVFTMKGNSIVHFAALGRSPVITKYLIKILDKAFIIAINDKGESPLHWAARSGNVESINCLIAAGCNPNLADYENNTALHFAVESGNLDRVKCLVAQSNINLEARNGRGMTPLALACYHDETEIIKYFLLSGASKKHIPKGFLKKNKLKAIKLLLKNSALELSSKPPVSAD